MSDSDYRKASATISHYVLDQQEYGSSRVIHCYVSINERKEVDTHALIKRMMQEDKKVVVPRMNFREKSMDHIHLTSFDRLEENDWGILEPTGGPRVLTRDIDLVIVPMVGADIRKNRMGYGGGFYDRFLESLDVPTVGLAFERCVVDGLPTDEHDVQLTKIITEQRVLT